MLCSNDSIYQASMKALDLGCKLDLSEVKLEETMKCTGQELYNALTQKDMIQIFTGSEAKMKDSAEPGGNFELLGGNITGQFTELTPFTKIVQQWRLKSWPQGVTSKVFSCYGIFKYRIHRQSSEFSLHR